MNSAIEQVCCLLNYCDGLWYFIGFPALVLVTYTVLNIKYTFVMLSWTPSTEQVNIYIQKKENNIWTYKPGVHLRNFYILNCHINEGKYTSTQEANPCLASSKILTPHPLTPWRVCTPRLCCGGRTHTRRVNRRWGSIFWKTPDTALYCTLHM